MDILVTIEDNLITFNVHKMWNRLDLSDRLYHSSYLREIDVECEMMSKYIPEKFTKQYLENASITK